MSLPTTRRAYRRTDTHAQDPNTPKVQLITEPLPSPEHLHPTSLLLKIHAVSLNYRDANIAAGRNPWPVIPFGIPGNDAAGEVLATGDKVSLVKIGERVAPITDSAYLTSRSKGRSWLAADQDGILADYVVVDESAVTGVPGHLDWVQASLVPCAGTTAWAAIRGGVVGQTVLIQGMYFIPYPTI